MVRRHKVFPSWPSWRYGPYGEAEIFECEADVPYGWTKKPGEVFEAPPQAEHHDRDQLISELAERGIIAPGHWSNSYMKELLG